jgi:hypothetical protein
MALEELKRQGLIIEKSSSEDIGKNINYLIQSDGSNNLDSITFALISKIC